MHDARWVAIELKHEKLTKEEIDEGWHFCPDWDYMLIGPGMDELRFCLCKKENSQSETQ